MRIYDVSMSVFYDMPVYKGKESKRPVLKVESDFDGGSVYETNLSMNLHTGTHIDAPLHMIKGGGTIDKLDLGKVITTCKVIDLTNVCDHASQGDLGEKDFGTGDFVLIKTKNSFMDILEKDYVYLDASGANYLKDKGVVGVGIDALGIERNQPNHETHEILLGSGIVILEGLRLAEVQEGEYTLFAAPINILGAEAAPVRAVLVKEE